MIFWEKIHLASIEEAQLNHSLHQETASLLTEELLAKIPLLTEADCNKLRFCLNGKQIAEIATLSLPENKNSSFFIESMSLEQFRQFLLSLPVQDHLKAKSWLALPKVYSLFNAYGDWLFQLGLLHKEKVVQLEHTLDQLEKSFDQQESDDVKSQIELFMTEVKGICKECSSALTLLWNAGSSNLIETIGFYKELQEDILLAIGEKDDLTNKTLYGTFNLIMKKNHNAI